MEVEWEKIGRILEAGKAAPSSGNIQNWKFIVVEGQEQRKQLAEMCLKQWWMAKAPIHIVVVAEPDKVRQFYGLRGERLYSVQNCSAAIMNMLLAAHSMGLGSCWVGAFEEDGIKRVCSIPQQARPQGVITIGYAAEKPPLPHEFSLEEVMFFRDFGGQPNRIRNIPGYKGEFSAKLAKDIEKGKEIIQKIGSTKKKQK
jgi:nitroreductase